MDYMLEQFNEIDFRVAVETANRSPKSIFNQTVPYKGTRSTTVYQSNYRIMALALALNIIALLSLPPLYNGWWRLGRKSTWEVLETAKAFGAPLLKDLNDNATTEQILHC